MNSLFKTKKSNKKENNIDKLCNSIKKFFEEKGYLLYDSSVKVNIDEKNRTCSVYLSTSSEVSDWVSFENLTHLSKLFNTTKINLCDLHHTPGCETCDHGSRNEITILIKNITIPQI